MNLDRVYNTGLQQYRVTANQEAEYAFSLIWGTLVATCRKLSATWDTLLAALGTQLATHGSLLTLVIGIQ